MRQKQYEAPARLHGNAGQRRTPASKNGQLPLIIQDGRGESPICAHHGSLMTLISGGKGRMRYRCPRCEVERRMDIGKLAERLKAGDYPLRLGRRQREMLPSYLVKEFDEKMGHRAAARSKKGSAKHNLNNRLKRFGLSLGEYESMITDQSGRCAICFDRAADPTSLHVDHCHKTGRVRGLLCHSCNTGLGHFRDSVVNLSKASAYLQERGM